MVPDLPEADYSLWVRGYGLVDSEKSPAAVGDTVDITATPAANPKEAAKVYPSNYWLSMYTPVKGADTGEALTAMKLTCMLCHQMGSPIPAPAPTWTLREGPEEGRRDVGVGGGLRRRDVPALAPDWGRRISTGELPAETPPRPTGAERNLVVTQWQWGDEFTYAHDEVATDKRDPTVNAGGPVWGVDLGNDRLLKLDPTTNRSR